MRQLVLKPVKKTIFQMNLDELRSDRYQAGAEGGEVELLYYDGPDENRCSESGTIIFLEKLTKRRHQGEEQFKKSMARRFLIQEQLDDFMVLVNDETLPESDYLENAQWVFPRDYSDGESPNGLSTVEDWGVETLSDGHEIKWRIVFHNDTIGDDDFRGISVFARGKLAQKPFFFNLSGGLSGQHGNST